MNQNKWQGNPRTVAAGEANGDTPCPNCMHMLRDHSVDLGCHVGWANPKGGGCECPFSLALQHGPLSEHEVERKRGQADRDRDRSAARDFL